jgi:hypothetical protein
MSGGASSSGPNERRTTRASGRASYDVPGFPVQASEGSGGLALGAGASGRLVYVGGGLRAIGGPSPRWTRDSCLVRKIGTPRRAPPC